MNESYDVFLSYHWSDREPVEQVARWLRDQGLTPFLDRWYLTPGQPWPQALERVLASCRAVAVMVGPGEMGSWQQREKDLALERQGHMAGFPVIPVLLPGSDPVLGFLGHNTWVDLRNGVDDPASLAILSSAIQGKPPGSDLQQRVQSTLASLCPYRGLLYFREEDAPFFFGRDAAIDNILATIQRERLIVVVGASGCGKSSVVRAGLIPRLRQNHQTTWEVITLFPGDDPLHSLAQAFVPLLEPEMTETERLIEVNKLAQGFSRGELSLHNVTNRILSKQRGTDRLLLVADQWEELYTLTRNEWERRRFIDELLDATQRESLSVVLTLRGDFVGKALAYRPLSDRLQGVQINLGPMKREELEQAIKRPAGKVNLQFEPGLIKRILDDVGEEPGNLPLLEFVLKRLWEDRQGGMLLHEVYDTMGGLQGAVAKKADELYSQLSPLEQEAVKRVFLYVVRPGEGGEDTRRRARLMEIGEAARTVVKKLADERLLVTAQGTGDEDTVEVSHEALIRHWNRLQIWLNEDREFLLWRERFRALFQEWHRSPEDGVALLRGKLLNEARDWLSQRKESLSEREQHFILESQCAQENEANREQEAERRRLRNLRWFVSVLFVSLLMSVSAALKARIEMDRAEVRELIAAADSSLNNDPQRSLLMAIRAVAETAANNETVAMDARARVHRALRAASGVFSEGEDLAVDAEAVLHRAVQASRTKHVLANHSRGVWTVAFSHNGELLATAGADGTARIWDPATGKQLRSFEGHAREIRGVAFSRDGKSLATASYDGTARVWDVKTGGSKRFEGHSHYVRGVAFSPDGSLLATASQDKTAILWETHTATPKAHLKAHTLPVWDVAFSPDGSLLATASADKTANIWDVKTGELRRTLKGHTDKVSSVAFSPDGEFLATSGADGLTIIWEVKTGRSSMSIANHNGNVWGVAFSPDGTKLATTGGDGTTKVWDRNSGQTLFTLVGHRGRVIGIAFSPDGHMLATASDDGTARVWDLTSSPELLTLAGHNGWVWGVAFSPDGTKLATASDDGTARIWDSTSGKELKRLNGHSLPVRDIAFDADGERLATSSLDGTAIVWNVASGKQIRKLEGNKDRGVGIALSPDGTKVATAMDDYTVRLLDVNSGKLLRILKGHKGFVYDLAFNAEGTRMATASDDETIKIWEVDSGTTYKDLPHRHTAPVRGIAFGPSGALLVSVGADGMAKIWDVAKGEVLHTLSGHIGEVRGVAFSKNGEHVATAGDDGIARVWNAKSGKLELTLQGHFGLVLGVSFSPDGKRLATAGADRSVQLYALDITTLVDLGLGRLRLANQSLVDECRKYLGAEHCRLRH